MPRKSRKPRKHEDPECKAKNDNKSSKDIPSSRQDESNSEVCSSSHSSAAVKNEEQSSASKTHETAVFDTQSHFSEISEGSKSSDEGISTGLQNEASSASFMEAVKENDNERNLKTTDATSADDSLLIQGNKNVTRQPETSDTSSLDFPPADRTLKNEIVSEQLCASAKASHSELSDATKIQMNSTLESNAGSKEDVICGPKQLAAGTSRSARTIHQEKSSDEEALWTGSADEDGNKVEEIKVDIKAESDSTFQEDLNSRSVFRSHPRNQVGNDSIEPGQQMCSSLGAVNIDSQLKHSTKKGRGETGVPFKHTSEAAIHEHNRKRPKSTSAVSAKTDMQKNKRENLKQRTKSEPASKMKSKLLSKRKSGKGINSPGTSFRAQESVNRDNDETGISHLEMSATTVSGTCDLEEQSKISLSVSLRKRKSTEYVPSGSSKKVSEEIPSKRMQRESSRESKTSPRGKSTSPRSPRKRQNKSGKSNSDSSPPKPLRTVTTSTESMTEYVGDAAFIAVGESPPRKSTTGSTSASHAEEPTTSKYKVVVYASDDRTVTTQTQSVKEYLIFPEDSLSHGSPVQPMMEISTDVTTIGTDNLHTESTLDRNLNVADELSETERSPTVSSSESAESDTNVKQLSLMTYRGARPKTRGKYTKEISPQKRYMAEHTGDILTVQFPEASKKADSSLEVLPKEDVKETDSLSKQSSSTIHMGARPKSCIKTRIFPKSGGDRITSGLSSATDQGQSSNVLLPSFEEFKETLGVDKVEVVDINFDVFDRALGIDRSSGDSDAEHRHDFKIISPKRLSEAMSHDNGESLGNKTAAKDPQSSEMVEDCLPTIEEFRRTLRTDQIPPLCEDASEILNKALEEMESKRQNLQSKKVVRFLIPKQEVPSTSKGKKSPERQMDSTTSQNAGSSKPFTNRGPVPGILAFSGYRKRENPIGLAVPDCFDLKAIANALDEILRSELENTAEEISNAPLRPDVIEDSEESIEDINRAIAKSGMKLKRSQVISSSDDEFTAARESVEVTLHSSTRVVSYEMHRDISETSRSSTASSEECNPNSSKYLEDSSESIVQSSESDEK